jgi:hypothetical protein
MRSFSERGVPLKEHGRSGSIDATPDRDNARAFFALTRHCSSPEVTRTLRTRRVIDWIIASITAVKLWWFEDAFICLEGLSALCDGPSLVNRFEGMSRPSFARTRIN